MHHDDAPGGPPPRKKPSRATGAKKTATRGSQTPSRGSTAKKTAVGRPRKKASELKGSRRADGSYVHPSRARPKSDRIEDKRTAMAKRAIEKEELPTADKDLPQGHTILLSEMADFINDYFDKKAHIKEFTPYDWWRRHKVGRLSTPLPKPVRMVGMGPLFRASDIVKWYRVYVANKGRWETGG